MAGENLKLQPDDTAALRSALERMRAALERPSAKREDLQRQLAALERILRPRGRPTRHSLRDSGQPFGFNARVTVSSRRRALRPIHRAGATVGRRAPANDSWVYTVMVGTDNTRWSVRHEELVPACGAPAPRPTRHRGAVRVCVDAKGRGNIAD